MIQFVVIIQKYYQTLLYMQNYQTYNYKFVVGSCENYKLIHPKLVNYITKLFVFNFDFEGVAESVN